MGDDHNDERRRPGLTRRAFTLTSGVAGIAANVGFPQAASATVAAPLQAQGPGPLETTLRVNGKAYAMRMEPRVTLLDALRERIGLTGTKKGCDMGQCGACTVLVDGRRVNACLTLAVRVQGKEITTIEGLAQGDTLHPMQAAFLEHDGFQCGYCTPGQIMSAVGMLSEGKPANDDELRDRMSGNICRCGAYSNIVAAIHQTMEA